MNRAGSGDDGFSEKDQQELSLLLEQHAPQLHDELTMLQALYEHAQWKRIDHSSSSSLDSTATAAAAASSSSTFFSLAIFVPLHVPDGNNAILSRVKLSIVLDEPSVFPDEGELHIHLKSADVGPAVRSEIAAAVSRYAEELRGSGSLTIASLAARCEELLLDVPVVEMSKSFGCCLNCNRKASQRGVAKTPQPLRVQYAADGAAAGNNDAPVLLKASCLYCHSDAVVCIPSFIATATECSFCMCEDFPMLRVSSGCRCFSCFDCFCRLADLAEHVVRPVFGWRGVGIACPNHKSACINEPGLIKLLPLRTMLRFQSFAIRDFAAKLIQPGVPSSKLLHGHGNINAFYCNNESCGAGAPQIQDKFGDGLSICLFCDRATCNACGSYSVRCECKELRPPKRRILSMVLDSLFEKDAVPLGTVPRAGAVCALEHGDLVVLIGGEQIIVKDVPLQKPGAWVEYIELHAWQDVVHERKRRRSNPPRWVLTFQGVPISPARALASYGVFAFAQLYVVPFFEADADAVAEEVDLWNFRRSAAADSGGDGAESSSAVLRRETKPCPGCGAPHTHALFHNCHHLTCRCRREWCFCCGGPWPCTQVPKCPLFCKATTPQSKGCGCFTCSDCKPSYPCPVCPGCPKCRPTNGDGESFGY